MARKTTRTAGMRRLRLHAALPMLVTLGLVGVTYLSLVAAVTVTDPYDIYRWGVRPELAANDVPRDRVVKWIDVVTKKPEIETFLVGSSVTAMYPPEQIAVAPSETVAYNLSYGGVRPRDRDMVLRRLERNSRAERIIITFDWMYTLEPDILRADFPAFLYDNEFTNDVRALDLMAIRRMIRIFAGDRWFENKADAERYATFVEKGYRSFQQPRHMAELQILIDRYRSVIDAPSGKTCATLRAVSEQLVPRVRAFADKGVKVDILVPILSYANYYYHLSDISPTMLDEQLTARRCLVEAVDGLPGVRVFAFDDDPSVAGDLGNFRDTGHVYNPELLKRFMASIVNGSNRLTRSGFDQYERRIRSAVKSYNVINSYLGIAAGEHGGAQS